MTLVDTNILIDILTGDPIWAPHSIAALAKCKKAGSLFINDIIYAELAAGFEDQSQLEGEIEPFGLTFAPLSGASLFLAGQTYRRYRAGGGIKHNVLADFFIGAQASIEGWPVLTRDRRRYRAYFPGVQLIVPENP